MSNTSNTDNTSINHDNTVNFMYFISNYPHDFINRIWTGAIADHFKSKFDGFCARFERSDLAFLKWFYELDHDHQTTLLIWVNRHYKAYSNLNL